MREVSAGVWLGAAISFTIVLGPAFFSDEMKALFRQPYYNGAAAQIVINRYFVLLFVCGGIAILHLILEKLYSGKAMGRLASGALALAISFALLGGFWLQPKLRELHTRKYDARSSVTARAAADRSFKVWHGVSQTMNLFVTFGVLVYFWRVSTSGNTPRFSSVHKFKG